MFRKLVNLLVLLAFVVGQCAHAESILTFEDEGRFQGVLKERYADIEHASPTILTNLRHFLGVDVDPKTGFSPSNQSEMTLWGLYEGQADVPQNYVNLLLQRLFPRDMVPNQASMSDPAHHLTAEMAGVILNTVAENPEVTADELFVVIDRCLHPQVYSDHDMGLENAPKKWCNSGVGKSLLRLLDPLKYPYNLPPGIDSASDKGKEIILGQTEKDKRNLSKLSPDHRDMVKSGDVGQIQKVVVNLLADQGLKIEKAKKEFAAQSIKARPLIHDFATVVVEALADQKKYADIYPRQTVEAALYAFAQHRIKRSSDQVGEVMKFHRSIPVLLKEGMHENFVPIAEESDEELLGKLGVPYTHDAFEKIKSDLVEIEYVQTEGAYKRKKETISDYEMRLLLKGNATFDGVFPDFLPYTTSRYTDPDTGKVKSFSDCGEASLLNIFRLMLWDFDTKEMNLSVFETIGAVHPKLQKYFEAYPTAEKQASKLGRHAWTQVVSGLTGKDIDYAKGGDISENGENVCEIIRGPASMAGVMRALLPTDEMKAIDKTPDVGERIKRTLDIFLNLFSSEDSNWAWSVKDAKEGKEQEVKGNAFLSIELTKTGSNVPVQDGEPMVEPLGKWELGQGHYSMQYPEGNLAELLTIVSRDRVKQRFLNGDKKLSFSDLTVIGSVVMPLEMLEIPSALLRTPLDKVPYWSHRFDRSDSKSLVAQCMLAANTNETEHLKYHILFCSLFGTSDMYQMATNFFDLLPCDDPATIGPILSAFVDGDGNFVELPEEMPIRFKKRFASMQQKILDPDFAVSCLEHSMVTLTRHIIREIDTERMTEKQAQIILKEFLEDAFRVSDWQYAVRKFGDLWKKNSDKMDFSPYFIASQAPTGATEPLLNSEDLVDFFNDNNKEVLDYLFDDLEAIPAQVLLRDVDGLPLAYHLKPEKLMWLLENVQNNNLVQTPDEAIRLFKAIILNENSRQEKMLPVVMNFFGRMSRLFAVEGHGAFVTHLQEATQMVRPGYDEDGTDPLLLTVMGLCHSSVLKAVTKKSGITLRQALDSFGGVSYVGVPSVIEHADKTDLKNADLVRALKLLNSYGIEHVQLESAISLIKQFAEPFKNDNGEINWQKFTNVKNDDGVSIRETLKGHTSKEIIERMFEERILEYSDFEIDSKGSAEANKIKIPYEPACAQVFVDRHLSGNSSNERKRDFLLALMNYFGSEIEIAASIFGHLGVSTTGDNPREQLGNILERCGINKSLWLTNVLAYWQPESLAYLFENGFVIDEDLVAENTDSSAAFKTPLGPVSMSASSDKFYYVCCQAGPAARKVMADDPSTLRSLLSPGAPEEGEDGVLKFAFSFEKLKEIADMLNISKENIFNLSTENINRVAASLLANPHDCAHQRLRDIISHFDIDAASLYEKFSDANKESAKMVLPDLFGDVG